MEYSLAMTPANPDAPPYFGYADTITLQHLIPIEINIHDSIA